MTIKVGDRLPEATLSEFIDVETEGCTLGPNPVKVSEATRGKSIRSAACRHAGCRRSTRS